jgi:hypothetical protein
MRATAIVGLPLEAGGYRWRTLQPAGVDELADEVAALIREHRDEIETLSLALQREPAAGADELLRPLFMAAHQTDKAAPVDWRRDEPHPCPDCGAAEGKLHEPRCDRDRCPFCGGQLLLCDCPVPEPGEYLPYIHTPPACARCLEPFPAFFMVPHEEWAANVPGYLQGELLCWDCYQKIAAWMQAARAEVAE